MNGPVLIVDDEPAIRSLVQDALTYDGYDTIAAANGAEALHVLDDARPACMLLDLNMPVLNGYEVLQTLHERGVHIPVLVVTADPRGTQLGPADGVFGIVPKPFNLDDLSAAVAIATQAVLPQPSPPVDTASQAWSPM